MNAPMHDRHPEAPQFDRLRAGLLDDQPSERTRLLEHLSVCARCRKLASWERLTAALTDAPPEPMALAGELHDRRRAALAGRGTRAAARAAPRLAIAAAVTVLLLGAGVFLALDPLDGDAPPVVARNGNVPDLYVDLDFYLWLSRQNEQLDTASGRS